MPKPPVPESAPLTSAGFLKEAYAALVAIPCCNESFTLPDVIRSLEKNSSELTERTLIIINVNNRAAADNTDNLKTLEWLQNYKTHLHLSWINNSVPPFSYPEKFGVGLARHQAVTAGMPFLSESDPVISLDGDSPVNEDYLKEIFQACSDGSFKAGHVNFRHRLEGTDREVTAIQLYDRHLHLHRERLEKAGSPHAWYAIGSTIVCTKAAYARAGGYSVRRMAGEDFYLLQQLSKTGCAIQMIEKAFVYPSNRPSDRVPFGTGKAVQDILESGEWHTYSPSCYEELGNLLLAVRENLNKEPEAILNLLSGHVQKYLTERNFSDVWIKLKANSRDEKMHLQKFHEWLDAFRTLKLIHHLTEVYPKEKISLS